MTSKEPTADVLVVGAGIAGLCASLEICAAGHTVVLLEASDQPGGRVRTDLVDGWALDRGFQVHDTAYPTVASFLDADALQLSDFTPGAVIHRGGRAHRVMDPRRRPREVLHTAIAPFGSVIDKAAMGALAARIALTPVDRLLSAPETTTYEALRAAHISDRAIDAFWRPFLSGVFLEDELRTSSRFFSVVLRSQARGSQCLPAAGIGAIPAQLAARLPPGTLRVQTAAVAVGPGRVELDDEALHARAVIVAADPGAAHRLLPQLGPPPRMNACTTAYFVAPDADPEPVIHLEGEGPGHGPIANAVVLPSRQPGVLLSVTGLGPELDLTAARRQLHRWYGAPAHEWEELARYRLPYATVDMPVPQGKLRREIQVQPGLFVAGDHRDSASTQGAAVSGRRAARAVLASLRR